METNKTHWKKVFNKDYLGAHDLEDGKDLKAVIKCVEVKAVKDPQGKEGKCNVATFTDSRIKPMILNVTNCKIVKKFAKSNFIEDWKNIPVAIYAANVKAFGEETEGLRFRDKQPSMTKPELTPNSEAWEMAKKFLADPNGTIEKIRAKYTLTPENEEKLKEAVVI